MLRRAKPRLCGKPTSSLQHQPFYPCLFRERAGVHRLRHPDPDGGSLISPALNLNTYVVGEMVGTGIWDGEREMGIGLHAHREDRYVWSHGGLVGVLYHF